MKAKGETDCPELQHAHRLLAAAKAYRARGWCPLPVRGKKPCRRGWSRGDLAWTELQRELCRPERGLGVLLGDRSGGLVDVDLDCQEALELAPALLPPTPLVHGRASRPWSHWWYCSPGALGLSCRGPAGLGMIVELRSTGAQTCVPPSRHPTGEGLLWESWGTPPTIAALEIQQAVGRLAAAAYLCWRGWPHAAAVSLARRPDRLALARLDADPEATLLRSWLGLAAPVQEPQPQPAGPPKDRTPSPYTAAILARTDVVAAARLLGLALEDHEQQPCPFHDDRHASFQVSGALWRCHAGCGSGNAIHFAAVALSTDYRTARNWLATQIGIDWRDYWVPRHQAAGKSVRS